MPEDRTIAPAGPLHALPRGRPRRAVPGALDRGTGGRAGGRIVTSVAHSRRAGDLDGRVPDPCSPCRPLLGPRTGERTAGRDGRRLPPHRRHGVAWEPRSEWTTRPGVARRWHVRRTDDAVERRCRSCRRRCRGCRKPTPSPSGSVRTVPIRRGAEPRDAPPRVPSGSRGTGVRGAASRRPRRGWLMAGTAAAVVVVTALGIAACSSGSDEGGAPGGEPRGRPGRLRVLGGPGVRRGPPDRAVALRGAHRRGGGAGEDRPPARRDLADRRDRRRRGRGGRRGVAGPRGRPHPGAHGLQHPQPRLRPVLQRRRRGRGRLPRVARAPSPAAWAAPARSWSSSPTRSRRR